MARKVAHSQYTVHKIIYPTVSTECLTLAAIRYLRNSGAQSRRRATSFSCRSAAVPPPANPRHPPLLAQRAESSWASCAMTTMTMDKVTIREERASSSVGEMEAKMAKRKSREWQETLRERYQNSLDHLLEKHWEKRCIDKDDPQVTQFIEKEFGGHIKEFETTFFGDSVVSIGLFSGEVMVFACSGTAVQYWNKQINQPHTIFVTSKCLADKFESNRTKDDNLHVRVLLPNNTRIGGFLGLFNDNIAIVTAFSKPRVYPVNLREPLDPERAVRTFALGRIHDGRLMGTECSHLDSTEAFVSCDCAITEVGLGGPVISFDEHGNGRFAGVMIEVPAKFLPTKLLNDQLQLFGQAVTETTHFREYTLPKGLHSVTPVGYLTKSLMHQSLGYPAPPPLVFELNGSLVGTFEELFGQPHACDGFYYDIYLDEDDEPIWQQLGKDVVQDLSRSVVLISSSKGDVRCFACTGLLITDRLHKFVLTSASLFRTGDDDSTIDLTLTIEVFLSQNQCVAGQLSMYHEDYNIAVVSLVDDLTDVCAQNIFIATKSPNTKVVVAIGRPTKDHEGLLMAAMGKLTQKRRRNKNQGSEFDCEELKLSTCKISKVGIGGPLIRLDDGSFVGMNFYAENGPTPYLPRSIIVKVIKRGIYLLSKRSTQLPVKLDMDEEGNGAKKNRWPVPKPYWYLPGNRHVLDLLVGKVPL